MIRLDSSATAGRHDRAGARSGRDFFADARLVIVVGKGGVGKTVLTTSLAVAAARRGLDALVIEVDGKNHVATILGTAPGGYEERTLIERDTEGGRGRVSARTITPERALADYLDEHGLGRVSDQLSRAGLIDLLATSTPGIKDLLVLGKIKHLEHSSPAGLIVVDAPASGHAVTFLKSAAALADTARSGRIHRQAVESLAMLRDPIRCQAVLVTLPEETPVNETIETERVLREIVGISTTVTVVNGTWTTTIDEAPAESRRSEAASAARFEWSISRRHQHFVQRLERELTTSIVRLPAIRGVDLGPDAIEALADDLGSQLSSLPPQRPRRRTRRKVAATPTEHDGSTPPRVGRIGPPQLRALIAEHSIVVCTGTGGVGKTTTAAALAIGAARRGKKAVVVTIDPAKRLADALGIGPLTNDPTEVNGDWCGTLHAVMLDAKRTFDDLIVKASRDEQQAARVLNNSFYQNLSTSLSGSQELMAMQRLHELHASRRWDLIVVDTPPTRHALAFLDAPSALTRLLESRLFRAVTAPGRGMLRLMSRATQALVRQIGRIIGNEVVDDAVTFLQSVDGIIEGFQERTREVVELLASDATAFVLVASPRRDATTEAVWFHERLAGAGVPVRAVVVNRLTPQWPPGRMAGTRTPAAWTQAASTQARCRVLENAAIQPLLVEAGDVPVARLPFLTADVHDVTALQTLADLLVGGPIKPRRRPTQQAPRGPRT